MTIDDIIRFFSASSDGQRMTGQPMGDINQVPQQGILNQPSAPMTQPVQQVQARRVPRFAPGGVEKRMQPLSPLEMVMNPEQGPVASVEADAEMANPMQMAMNPTDQRLAERTQRAPQDPDPVATPERGFFDKFFNNTDANGNSAFMYAMRGLGAAGSQDPMKAMAQFAAQDAETGKLQEARRTAMKPKFTPFGPGTVMVEHMGKVNFMPVEEARAFALQMEGVKATNAQDRQVAGIVAGEEAKNRIKDRDGVIEAAGGITAKPEFSADVRAGLDRVDSLLKRVPKADTLPGGFNNPAIANAIDQSFGRALGTPDYEARRDADTLFKEITLSFVKKLGSNPSEGDRLFAERMQAAQDDPTSRKLALLQEYRERTERAENTRVENAMRRDALPSSERPQLEAAPPAPVTQPAPVGNARTPMAIPGLSQRTYEKYGPSPTR